MRPAILKFAAIGSIALLGACGEGAPGDVVGPEDYVHVSEYFTMDEAVTNEMTMDGGSVLVDPAKSDPYAAILTADALPGDKAGELLTSEPANSPAVETAS